MTDSYTCANCGNTYDKRQDDDWSDEHAMREARETFSGAELETLAVVCDDCFKLISPHIPRLRAELDQDAAALGISYDEMVLREAGELGITADELAAEQAELDAMRPAWIPGLGMVSGLAAQMLSDAGSPFPFRRAVPENRCYRTPSGLAVHVKPGCPHRAGR